MQEQTVRYGLQDMSLGLRADSRAPRNSRAMVQIDNMKPSQYGLVESQQLRVPFNVAQYAGALITPDWPYPMLFHGANVTLLADDQSIRLIDTTTDPWSIGGAGLATKSTVSPYGAAAIPAGGGPWQFIDLYDQWLLFKDNCVVFKCNAHNLPGSTIPNNYFCYTARTMTTGCHFRGKLYYGGFDSTDDATFWGTLYENDVIWSSTAGQHNGDDLWQFFPALMTDAFKHEAEIMNSLGRFRMPFRGLVKVLKPLGQSVIAYTDNGVVALPFANELNVGMKEISPIGVFGRGAVGGHNGRHIFLDKGGKLWSLSPDLQLQELGYEEYLKTLTPADVVISYDKTEAEHYISDGDDSYILTGSGMGSTSQHLTSVVFAPDSDTDLGVAQGIQIGTPDTDVVVLTDEFDFGLKANKRITSVAMEYKDLTNVKVYVQWRNDSTSAFTEQGPFPLNEMGWVMAIVSGVNFRLRITATLGTAAQITTIRFRYQIQDNRNLRGPSIPDQGSGG